MKLLRTHYFLELSKKMAKQCASAVEETMKKQFMTFYEK